MLLEKLAESLKNNKVIRILFIAMVVVLLILYFATFLQNGTSYASEFLIKQKSDKQILFTIF